LPGYSFGRYAKAVLLMELLAEAGLFLAGVCATAVVSYYAPGLLRRAGRRPPLQVAVLADLRDIHIGAPDWDGFAFVTAQPPRLLGPPPDRPCRNWWRWAHALALPDANITEFEVILAGVQEVAVVVQGVEINIVRQSNPTSRHVLACPVGGADGSPRYLRVNLDWPIGMTTFVAAGGEDETSSGMFLHLSKGDVEKLRVRAVTETSDVEWRAQLVLVVGGHVQRYPLDVDGEPFRTCAALDSPRWTWEGDEWVPLDLSAE